MAEQGEGDAGGGGASSEDTLGTGNDARVALLNSIGDSYDEIRADELADVNDDGTTEEFKVRRPEGEEESLVDDSTAVEEPEAPATQMITRKVNGKDVTLPLEEWLVRAQKVESADEYLQDAATRRKESMRAEQPAPQQPVQQGPSKEEKAAQELAERRKLARAIQMGTEEEAVAAIEQLQHMSQSPTLTVEDVGRVADERLRFNTALTWFSNEYSDLTTNPQLYRMVVEAESALVRNGDRRPYAERYADVGNSIRTWRDNLVAQVKPSAPIPPVASLDAKRAAKAAAPKTPAMADRKATPVARDEEDESPSSVIAAMTKTRGGPQWARG